MKTIAIFIITLMLLASVSVPSTVKAEAIAWPTGYTIEGDCYTATAHNTIAIGTTYKIGSRTYVLKSVSWDGWPAAYFGGSPARGKLTYYWQTVDSPVKTHTEKIKWDAYRPAYCTDCLYMIHGSAGQWSSWEYSYNGRSRTRTRNVPLYDADYPSWYCGKRILSQSENAELYCDGSPGETDWYFPLEYPFQ